MAEDKLQWKKMSNGDIEWSLPDIFGSVPSFVVDAITADLQAQVAEQERVIEWLACELQAGHGKGWMTTDEIIAEAKEANDG